MDYLSFQGLNPADNTTELEAVVIQGGIDKRASGTALLAQINRSSGIANIKDFGAKLDGVVALGGMNSGNATVTATTAVFTSTAVDAGKLVYVAGAGASGGPLLSSIVTVTDSTHAVVANAAGTTVSNAVLVFGTNDRAAWMAAINRLIYDSGKSGGIVSAPPGTSIIGDSILAGYGELTVSRGLAIQGAGIGLTTVFTMFHDRPGISFQGLKVGRVSNLTIRGLNREYVDANQLGSAGSLLDDTNLANWLDSHLTADTQYAPCVGIAVDPVSGSQPGTHYPTVDYDTNYYPSPTQYGKAKCSNVLIADIEVIGFAAGVCFIPNSSSAGLHVDVLRSSFSHCKWGISITSTSDNSADNLFFSQVGCALVNNVHGQQIGTVSGTFTGWRFVNCSQIMQLSNAASPIEFTGLMGSVTSIGKAFSATPNAGLVISNFNLDFSNLNSNRGVGLFVLDVLGTSQVQNVLRNGLLANVPSIAGFNLYGDLISFENVRISTPSRVNSFEKFASNVLCGGFMTWQADYIDGLGAGAGSLRAARRFKWSAYNLDTSSGIAVAPMQEGNTWALGSRPYCIPYFADQIANPAGNRNSVFPTISCSTSISKGSATISAKSLTGIVLLLTLNQTAAQMACGAPNATGLANGDVIIDDQTGTVWFVRSVTGSAGAYVVMADQQNNYKLSLEGAYTNPVSISLTTGNWIFVNSRVYTTTYAMFGTTSSGSGAITAAGRSDGNNAWMTTDLVNGDYVQIDVQLDNWIASAIAGVLSAVAAGSFTVGSNANVTAVKKRLPYFVRPGPANNIGTLTLSGTYPGGSHLSAYDHVVKITGGIPTYNTPTVASGAIPTGTALSIVGATLRLYGATPTAGHYTGTVTVKDSQTSPATSNALAFDITIT